MVRRIACLLFFAVGTAGCSDSSLDVDARLKAPFASALSAEPAASGEVEAKGRRLVSGNGTKGPLIEATVELFALNATGAGEGGALASTVTDAQGNWQLDVNRTDPVLVRVSGGSYVDEADTNVDSRRIIQLSPDQFLESILFPDETSVAVTVFTQALLQKSRRETGQNLFIDVLNANRQLFLEAYGFDVMSTLPADPLAPAGSAEAVAYALNVGGVANAINALSIASDSALPEYQHIVAVVNDLVDCRLDGLGTGGQPVFDQGESAYGDLTLAQQALRFRNNNFSLYQDVQPQAIDPSPCDLLGGTPDVTAPVFSAVPQSLQFEAVSASGVVLSDEQMQSIVSQYAATDDRAGSVPVRVDIPQVLALGSTAFTAFAEDEWGNVANVGSELVVADTTPPQIEGAPAVSVDAQGTLTEVVLVPPAVSDLVSLSAQIVLSNNAPAAFPVGPTDVVWTATDEAGNQATLLQQVTVNSLPPEVTAPPPLLEPDAGSVDFSSYFSDPDGTSLSYEISGLPEGTGLSLDPATGVLTGTPTAADVEAQPLAVTVTATDGQTTVAIQTTINVVAPNSPPAFSVSSSALTLNEDFGTQVVQILPESVPEAEQDQVVSYTLEVNNTQGSAAPALEAALDAGTRTITLSSRENASGSVQVTVTANDGQTQLNLFSQVISVEVLAINDVPTAVTGDVIELVAGQSFTVALSDRAIDVEDAALEFSADQLPSGVAIAGVELSGVALPEDALSQELPINFTALDSDGASVNFTLRLRVTDPDQDGDGLSDYTETLLGFDPLNSDTDGDGFGDSLEALTPIDTNDTTVVFVGSNGDDTQTGESPDQALASLSAASQYLSMLDASRFALVLVEKQSSIGGSIVLSGQQRTLLGGVDFTTLQIENAQASPFSSQLANAPERVVVLNDCMNCEVSRVRIETGAGMAVINSVAAINDVHIVSTTGSDGGALYLDDSVVTAARMLMAANRAVRGGAVLLENQSQLSLSDSTLTGNKAVSGAGVTASDSVINMSNVVIAANAAVEGVVIDVTNSTVEISNASIANNTLESPGALELMRCRNTFLAPCSSASAPIVRDSVIAGNRNLASEAVGLGATGALSAGLFVEPGLAAQDTVSLATASPFAVAYSSNEATTFDAGSQSVVAAQLDKHFSKTASVFADQGVVDAGAHYAFPLARISSFRPIAILAESNTIPGLRAVDIKLAQTDQPLREVRRLAVSSLSDDVRSVLVSPGVLPAEAAGEPGLNAVPAISLGDGRYRVWLSTAFNLGRDKLSLWLDDSPTDVKVSVVCAQPLCGAAGLDSVSNPDSGSDGLDSERITPVIEASGQ